MSRFPFDLSNVMLPALGRRSTCDGIVDALRFPYIPWAGILRKVPYSQILSHEAVRLKSCFVLGMLCLYNIVSFLRLPFFQFDSFRDEA